MEIRNLGTLHSTCISSVLHLLPTSLFQLGLSLALPSRTSGSLLIVASHQSTHTSSDACVGGPGKVDGVQRHDRPKPPSPVAKETHSADADPGPVCDIPHPFCETFGLQILASAFELTIDEGGSANALEPEFDQEGRSIQNKVQRERSLSAKDVFQQQEEQIDS